MEVLKKLLPYVKTYKIFAVIAPLFMCVEVVMDLFQPTLMQKIIDNGIANQDNAYVTKMGIMMLLCAVLGLLGGMGNSIFATKASVHFAADLRKDTFTKIERFSNQNVDSFSTGKLITIVTNDIATVQHALMLTMRIFVRGPLLFLGSVVIVWYTARQLFPILLVVIPILIFCIYFFSVKSAKLFAFVQKAMDQVNGKLQETLAGIRVIKAYDRHEYERKQFKKINDLFTKRNLTAEQVALSLMPIMMLFVNIGIVAGLWLGVIKVNEGTLQVGVILAFINYLNIMMNGLMSSSSVLMQIARSIPSAKRIVQVFDTKIDLDNPIEPTFLNDICGDVEFKDVCFSYSKNGEYVLKNISFHVKAGQKVGIIGPTGSGKSTLIKLLPRLYDPDSGKIYIDGVNIKEIPLEKLRAEIGLVPQKATLFSGTIKENLRFGKEKATDNDLEEAAQSAAALEFINKFEGKFEHELMQGATNLSGGQKQRLSLARAFVRKPKILILDDSTSAVDALSERSIQQALKSKDTNTTVLIISSKISSIIDADQIIVLDDGKVDAIGTHGELLKKSKVYQDIYMSQKGKEVEYV